MKAELIASLREYKDEISALKRCVAKLTTKQVSRKGLREAAENIASRWVEEFRSRLEHKFEIDKAVIEATAAEMKNLNVLRARPKTPFNGRADMVSAGPWTRTSSTYLTICGSESSPCCRPSV